MNLLVDGVFFQLASTGIARVWRSLLARLGRESGLRVMMLDRGRCPVIEGVQSLSFPAYSWTYTATDSLLIQKVCDECHIDVFSSTYYTTATRTPQVQLVYDMIPEVMNFNMSARAWKEKQLALSYSSRLACISNSTRQDLLRFYPGIEPERTRRTYCGIEADIFRPQASKDLAALRQRFGLVKPYLLLVGSREQHDGYKNAKLLFDALSDDEAVDLDVVCVGGEKVIPTEWLALLPERIRAIRIDVSDAELATLYTGALALVYPSLYEGFGLPVLEAMACGCPVITTHCGSLREVAGDAALVISGRDRQELSRALETVRDPTTRDRLVAAGLERPRHFSWDAMAHDFHELAREAHAARENPATQLFHDRWHKLRTVQAEVDIGHD